MDQARLHKMWPGCYKNSIVIDCSEPELKITMLKYRLLILINITELNIMKEIMHVPTKQNWCANMNLSCKQSSILACESLLPMIMAKQART